MTFWKKLVLITVILLPVAVWGKNSTCIECHLSTDWVSDTTIAADFLSADIHHSRGLGCQDCHGGDPTRGFEEGDPDLAMDPAKGFKPPPSRLEIPDFCARCHSDVEYMKEYNPRLSTDQLKLYKTSIHGKQLYAKKDPNVAVCTDCHGIHGILPSTDSRSSIYHMNVPETCRQCHGSPLVMKGYKYKGRVMPTNQYEEYSKSVHGILVLQKGDVSAPACNDCHGNHGATPPNLASVSAACGECHAQNRDFFDSSPHKEAWLELGYPQCEQCHGNHLIRPPTDAMIGTQQGSVCLECHDKGSGGYQAAAEIRADIDSLETAISTADEKVKEAEKMGVEGGQAGFDLGSARDKLTQVRSVIHTFDPAQVKDVTSPGIKTARQVQETAEAALGDIRARQIGLAISLLLVALVAILLWRKIRQVDKRTDFEVKD